MKRIVLVGYLIVLATTAFAGLNPYTKVNVGYNHINYKIDEDSATISKGGILGIGGAIGNNFSDKFRAEIAYSFSEVKNKTNVTSFEDDPTFDCRDSMGLPIPSFYCTANNGSSNSKVKQHIFLLNGFYYPLKENAINPFIGAGVGWGFLKNANFSSNSNNFAYALYVGADYNIYKKLVLEISANYTSILSPIEGTKDVRNFGANVSIRYNF